VVVSDHARPSAPTPSLTMVATLEPSSAIGAVADGETAADDVDDRPLCTGDLLVTVGKLTQDPPRQDLLQPSVEDPARQPGVEVGAKDALSQTALDHPLDRREPRLDLVHLLLQVRAARHLAHHHPDEIGIVPPRAEQDLRDPPQLLVGRLIGLLHAREASEQLTPVLAEKRRQHLFLGREVVIEQAVRDASLLRDVPHARGVIAVAREHADGSVEDEAALLLAPGLTVAAGALARD